MNVSASGLTRFRKCVASSILPQVKTTSEAAETGTTIHTFCEQAATVGKEKALANVPPELWGRCTGIDVEAILHDLMSRDLEVAYALDPVARTARRLGNSLGRNYPELAANEIAGSEDVIGVLNNGRRVCVDYKSGEYVGPASENSQLKFFAACIYLIEGVSEVEGRIVYINEDGSHWTDSAVWTAFDIEEYIDSLASAVKQYHKLKEQYDANRDISVNQGEWCRYCGSIAACPAYTGLARRLVPELDAVDQMLAAMTPEQAGFAWGKYRQAKEVFERIENGLKEYARNVGIRLPDGRVVTGSTFSRKYFSTDKAVQLLGMLGATKKDIDSCYNSKVISTVKEKKQKE